MEDLILLVGFPNAGKSTAFNALTGGHAKVGNWHGVTVGALEGEAKLGGKRVKIVDLPGIYSLESLSMEEKFTRDYLAAHTGALVLFVAECASFDRTLPLLHALAERGHRVALLLTKQRAFQRAGGTIDAAEIGHRFCVPVILAEGRGLLRRVEEALSAFAVPQKAELSGLYTPPKSGLSKADKLLLNGFFCIPLFLVLLLAAFFLTFASGMPGDLMKGGIEWFFSDFLGGRASRISSPVLRSFLCDGVLSGLGSVMSLLPQIALLYFFLTLMEESGFLSRLAVLTDGLFARIGLNGRAVFSLLMGFGCTAAAILTTRGLDDKRVQRRVILSLPYISCSAKLPVYLTLSSSFFENPFPAVLLLYTLGVGLSIIVAYLLKDKISPPFLMELAPLQVPSPVFVIKSLLFQIKQFIIKVATVILAFFLFSWVLSSFTFSFRLCGAEESMLATVCGGLKFLFAPIGMPDWRIAYAALSGLVAKENVAGAIAMLYGTFPYSGASGFAFSVFILACSPCVSAIAVTSRELGKRRAALYAAVQTGTALLLSYATYFALMGGALVIGLAVVLLAAILILGRTNFEKLRRKRKHKSQGLHGQRVRAGVLRFSRPLKGARRPRKRREGGGESPAPRGG